MFAHRLLRQAVVHNRHIVEVAPLRADIVAVVLHIAVVAVVAHHIAAPLRAVARHRTAVVAAARHIAVAEIRVADSPLFND